MRGTFDALRKELNVQIEEKATLDTNSSFDEHNDREERKRNIIVFNVL